MTKRVPSWKRTAAQRREVAAPTGVATLEKKKPFPLNIKLGDNSSVLLKFNDALRLRIEEHLLKLQELHYYAQGSANIDPEIFREAQELAKQKGAKHANEFLAEKRKGVKKPVKYRPSRHSFVYLLVMLGMDAYEKKVEQYQQQIVYGEANLPEQK